MLAAACALMFVFLPGCPKLDEGSSCDGLVEGQVYEVELQILDGDVLYAVEAEQEGDDDECEQEGENEGENEDCDAEEDTDAEEDDDAEYDISAQVTAVADDLTSFELLGALTVTVEADAEAEIAITDLAVGMWVEVAGELEGGVFEAEELELADEQETEIEGVISDLTDTSFTMAGLVITYDDATEIECADSEDEDEEGDEDDEEDDA